MYNLAINCSNSYREPTHGISEKAEFEKWRAIRASVSDVGGVLAWVTWVARLHGWRANVGYLVGVLAWVMWVVYAYVFTCILFRFGIISQITN